MRVVLAGSSGLIGTALVAELRAAGHEVRRLVRREAVDAAEFRWDPPAGQIPAEALDGADAVVNLCGASLRGRWSAADKQRIRDSRVEPTEVLAEAVAEHGVGAMFNASGIGYYGTTTGTVVDEASGSGDGFLAELCVDWERAAEPAGAAGARVVRLRSGVVLAGRSPLLRQLKPLFQLGLGGRLGHGQQYLSWISLTDEMAAIRFLLEHDDISGPVNLCTPTPVTNREFTKALGGVLHRPTPWWVPRLALRVVIGEAADELAMADQRADPGVLTGAGFTFRHTEIDAALAEVL